MEPGRADLPRTLGRHCPRPCPNHLRVVFFWNRQLQLRSGPPFTGVLRGPGRKVPSRVLFQCFWAPGSECPKECFLSAFWRFLGPAGAPKYWKSTPGGTFRPGPLSAPVNGGPDRNCTACSSFLRRASVFRKLVFRHASGSCDLVRLNV